MSVVNEALRDLQKRRAQIVAERQASGLDRSSGSPLSLAIVRSWVHQPVGSEALSPSLKMSLVLAMIGLLVVGRLLWNPLLSHVGAEDELLTVQLSGQFYLQEKSKIPDELLSLNRLTQLKVPALPNKIMPVSSAKKVASFPPVAHGRAHFSPREAVFVEHTASIKLNYQVQDDIDHAMDVARDRGYGPAKVFLTQLMGKYPNQPEYVDALLRLMIQNKHWDEAWPVLKTARDKFTGDDGFRLLEARYYVEQKQWVKANELLKVDPNLNQVEYLSLLAMIKQEIKEFSGANKLYQRLHQLELSNPSWQLGLGMTYEAMGSWNEARSAYVAAQNSTGLSAESYGFIRQKLDDWHH